LLDEGAGVIFSQAHNKSALVIFRNVQVLQAEELPRKSRVERSPRGKRSSQGPVAQNLLVTAETGEQANRGQLLTMSECPMRQRCLRGWHEVLGDKLSTFHAFSSSFCCTLCLRTSFVMAIDPRKSLSKMAITSPSRRMARGIGAPNSAEFRIGIGGPRAALIAVPIVLLTVGFMVIFLYVESS
jgi:hypothetical protein